jgi:hypothetical protein
VNREQWLANATKFGESVIQLLYNLEFVGIAVVVTVECSQMSTLTLNIVNISSPATGVVVVCR